MVISFIGERIRTCFRLAPPTIMNRRHFIQIAAIGAGALPLGMESSAGTIYKRVALHLEDGPLSFDSLSCRSLPGLAEIVLSPRMTPPEGSVDHDRGPGSVTPRTIQMADSRCFLRELRSADLTVTTGQAGGDGSLMPSLIAASRHLLVVGPLAATPDRVDHVLEVARRHRTPISIALPDPLWLQAGARDGMSVDLGQAIHDAGAREWHAGCMRSLHGAIHAVLAASAPEDELLAVSALRVPARARSSRPPVHHLVSLHFHSRTAHIRLGSAGATGGFGATRSPGGGSAHRAWDASAAPDLAGLIPGAVPLYDMHRTCQPHAAIAERAFACCLDSMVHGGREVMLPSAAQVTA
jgi:hypothetical protein